MADGEGNNGSSAASKQPEFAANSGAGLNLSHSLNSSNKPHAWLELERGRSVGKKFTLTDGESQIGRWDADGGFSRTSILMLTIRRPKFRGGTRASSSRTDSTFLKIKVRRTEPL